MTHEFRFDGRAWRMAVLIAAMEHHKAEQSRRDALRHHIRLAAEAVARINACLEDANDARLVGMFIEADDGSLLTSLRSTEEWLCKHLGVSR